MRSIRVHRIIPALAATLLLAAQACQDTTSLEDRLSSLEGQLDELYQTASRINQNSSALKAIFSGKIYVASYQEADHGYVLSLSDGTSFEVTYGLEAPGIVPVVGVDADGNWIMSVDGGRSWSAIEGCSGAYDGYGKTPLVKVDAQGYWLYSVDDGQSWQNVLDSNDVPISAADGRQVAGTYSFFKNVTLNDAGDKLLFTLTDGREYELPVQESRILNVVGYSEGAAIRLDETLVYPVEMENLASAVFSVPSGWSAKLTDEEIFFSAPSAGEAGEYGITLVAVSDKGLMDQITYKFTLKAVNVNASTCETWNNFMSGGTSNVLADFSYAGYNHGESVPADVNTLGYTVYDVTKYGAVADDGNSDRDALIACLTDAFGAPVSSAAALTFTGSANARAIIYFPPGEFILHTAADNVSLNPDGLQDTQTMRIIASRFVIKGAGADKTRLVMQDPLLPVTHQTYTDNTIGLYSSSWLFELGRVKGGDSAADSRYTGGEKVTSDAKAGEFSVKVAHGSYFKPGKWYCMRTVVKDADYISDELAGHDYPSEWDISETGISLREYHQAKEVSGNTVTFYEPFLHDIDASRDFYFVEFDNSTEIGVEDITFVGANNDNFIHHGSWLDDGGFKPLIFYYTTNSWLRRCSFESVSEACTFQYGACNSMYDLKISGNRGHNNARLSRQSFSFVGKVTDVSSGKVSAYNPSYSRGMYLDGAGSFHGNGVANESCGNVFWRDAWGLDAGFESHGRQSRSNLFDCCEGGFLPHRQGGGEDDMPNHLKGLVFWNFNAANAWNNFDWWSYNTAMYVVEPVVVGMHGSGVTFVPSSVLVDESNGSAVDVESLYEAQLRLRLGYIPSWLGSLK